MFNRKVLGVCLATLLSAGSLSAADLAGRWAATLHGDWTSALGQKEVRHRASGSILGAGGMLAYNFSQNWAAGGSYTNMHYQGELRAEPIEAVLIRRFPMAGDWAPYGRAGAGLSRGLDNRISFEHAATSFALGAEKYICRDWAVGLEGLWRYISDTGDSRLHAHNLGIGLNLSWFFPSSKKETSQAAPVAAASETARVPAPVDSDGDGIVDAADHCAGTPAGVKVDAAGCPLDTDKDGVFDHLDKCPGTPAGVKVDAAGCPLPLDSDKDGVLDTADKCPGTPVGAKVDETGCLARAPEKVTIELNVLFDTAKDEVKSEYHTEIMKVSDFMKAFPDTRAEIEGHTDDQGAADYNRSLSQKRADAVRKVLIEKFGVPADRLTSKGYGPDKPIADNATEEGRMKNRRVVATVSATY